MPAKYKALYGLYGLQKSGTCVIHDDMDFIRNKLLQSNLVILGAPTYWGNVPAPVKNVFDRLVGAVIDKKSMGMPKGKLSKTQKYILMTTCNTPFPFDRICKQSTGCIKAMREFFHTAGLTYKGKIIISNTKNKSSLPEKTIHKIQQKVGNAL